MNYNHHSHPTSQAGRARSHTNIALIKYWGKRDAALFLPMNSSLSLTLEAFYTDTKVTIDPQLTEDVFYLNHELQSKKDTEKISRFLNLYRSHFKNYPYVRVDSLNFVPTAAGLASSASAFSALAVAANEAFQLHLSQKDLSIWARQGSGSATRSLYGGFVEWEMGQASDSKTSFAIPVDEAKWDVGMVIIVVNAKKKAVSSRKGMESTVHTSPFYNSWVTSAKEDLKNIKHAIKQQDLVQVGEIMESNGMKMHATMLSAFPPICYFEPDSIKAQQAVRRLREKGIPAYFTMDAGPNVKVLCPASQMDEIIEELAQVFPREQLIKSQVGPGAYPLTEEEWLDSYRQKKAVTGEAYGKLFIAGEYAVLEPKQTAIIGAVNAKLTVTLTPTLLDTGTLRTQLNHNQTIQWSRDEYQNVCLAVDDFPVIEQTIQIFEKWANISSTNKSFFDIDIHSHLQDDHSNLKIGLGSSGAVTVALLRALSQWYQVSITKEETYKLGVLIHQTLKSKGSFGDIAASVYGGIIAYTAVERNWLAQQYKEQSLQGLVNTAWKDLRISPLPHPSKGQFLIGWTKEPAPTENYVAKLQQALNHPEKAHAYQGFLERNQQMIQQLLLGFYQDDNQAIQSGLAINRKLLNELEKIMDIQIETPKLTSLCEVAIEHGASAKSSGAGGGDCGICFAGTPLQSERIVKKWREIGIQPLATTLAVE